MKIIEIYIYGYGKLENFQIENLVEFQVIYGENEAGKSTIMSFIHSILFGFPTKNQVELRYEPKENSKYGGRLKVEFPNQEIAVIERVRGKATGDVTVILDNGTSGGEELLRELLYSVDKALFQSIFSFNLNGLQNVQKFKGEELGKFLFSAGIVGTERLALTESFLQKEMESRFKPSGKKPLLNIKLQELREQYVELKKAEQQNDQYWSYVQEHEAMIESIKNLALEIEELHRETGKLNEIKRLLPLIQEEEQILTELNTLGELRFPADGVARLESLTETIKPLGARVHALNQRIDALKQEIHSLVPNDSFLKKEVEILSVVEEIPFMNKLLQDHKIFQHKLSELNEEIQSISERLNLDINEEEVIAANTSVFMKKQIDQLQSIQERLNQKKDELDQSFQSEKNLLEAFEGSLKDVKSQLLSDTDRASLQEQLEVCQKEDMLRGELLNLQEQSRSIKMNNKRVEQRGKKQGAMQLLLFIGIFSFISIYGFINDQMILIAFGALGIFGLLISKLFINPKSRDDGWKNEIKDLQEREKKLKIMIESASSLSSEVVKEKYNRDLQLREQFGQLVFKVEQQTGRYEKVISDFEGWEAKVMENNNRLLAIGNELKVPEEISLSHLKEAFEFIEKLKQLYRERSGVNYKLTEINQNISEIKEKVNRLSKELLGSEYINVQEAALVLKKSLRSELDKKIVYDEKMLKLKEVNDEQEMLVDENSHLLNEVRKLLKLGDSETEEQFRVQAKKADRRLKLKERLADIKIQLHISEEDKKKAMQLSPETNLEQLAAELEKCKLQYQQLQEDAASVKYKMEVLEEGGLYADLLHKYKQMKYEFEEESKIWTRFAIARDMLSKTIERYKRERLPAMLEVAGHYLQTLTDGSYIKIHSRDNRDGFVVERRDQRQFDAGELSQATAEQVYLAVRLALTTTLYKHFRMPIIIDDSFVNFDHVRMKKVIELLKNQKEYHQILFFTCHKHLLTLFNREDIIDLNQYNSKHVNLVNER